MITLQNLRTRAELTAESAVDVFGLATQPLTAQSLWHLVRRGAECLLVALQFTVTGSVAAAPPILTLNDANNPPFTNSERTGYLDVIATEAFRRAGLELRLVKLPAERALRLANDGIIDGELVRIAGMEKLYRNLVPVPEKLTDWHFAAFSKDASIPADFVSLRGRAVGLIRGWKIYEQAMEGSQHLIMVDDQEQLFRLLQLDRIEVALYGHWMGLALVKEKGIVGIQALQPLLAERAMFIYLNKRHAEHVPKIAAALRALKREGFYDKAYRERLLPYAERAAP